MQPGDVGPDYDGGVLVQLQRLVNQNQNPAGASTAFVKTAHAILIRFIETKSKILPHHNIVFAHTKRLSSSPRSCALSSCALSYPPRCVPRVPI